MEHDETFGATVRRRREALHLTRGALAASIHCSEATIKKIERDERRPSPEVALLLAERLRISAPEREGFLRWARGIRPGLVGGFTPPPPFTRASVPARVTVEPFVARERELAYLHDQLGQALAGQGRVVFVSGSAGSGKSALVRAFAEQSLHRHPRLVTASGACTAYVGIGDPYLPFREQLDLLTGAILLPFEAGTIDDEAMRRLWELLPYSCDALLAQGPDLVGVFRSAQSLASYIGQAADAGMAVGALSARLQAVSDRAVTSSPLSQLSVFTQLTRVFQAVAEHYPLLLIADDLQWADEGTLSLLFHLGRKLAGHRILLVGIYRPGDAQAGDGAPAPLRPVVNELQRLHGTRTVDLGQVDRQQFIDALLDRDPNRLGPAFRAALFRQTAGHALFTVETLRDMREQGVLRRDQDGVWVVGALPDWTRLPARAEGVIRERLDRLPDNVRALLTAASVEGESFTVEVVAAAIGQEPCAVRHALGIVLADRQHLVEPEADRAVGGVRLGRYRFRHNLFQTYLYHTAGAAERAMLHRAVGAALERLYARSLDRVAPQLAHHYLAAGSPEDAIRTLELAAEGARRLYAISEALRSYDQALRLVADYPRAATEHQVGRLHEQRGRTRVEAGEFAGAVTDLQAALATYPPDDLRARDTLVTLGMAYRRRDDYTAARASLAHALRLARAIDDTPGVANILYHLGTVAWSAGDNVEASAVHEEAVTICRREGLGGLTAIQALHGWGEALLAQGRPNHAMPLFAESLALARAVGDRSYEAENLMMLGFAQAGFTGVGDYPAALACFDEALAISQGGQLDWHTGYVLVGRGQARGRAGDYCGGVADLHEALALQLSGGTARYQIMASDMLGDLLAELGEREQVLALRERTLVLAQESGSAYWTPRLLANLVLAQLALGDMSGGPLLEEALRLALRNGQGFHALRCLEGLAALRIARGAYLEAVAFAEQLAEYGRTGGLIEHAALADLWQGRAWRLAGNLTAAETSLCRAAAVAHTIERPCLQIEAHRAFAELYIAKDMATEAGQHTSAAGRAAGRIRRPEHSTLAG